MKKLFTFLSLSLSLSLVKADYWTQKANIFTIGRSGAVGFSIGSKGYIGTGYQLNTFNCFDEFWEWDQVTGAWTQKADFAGTPRGDAAGFSIGNKGYIITGYDSAGSYTNDFWQWDKATNTWTQLPSFPGAAQIFATAFSIGSKGYVCGGYSLANGILSEAWEWDQSTGIWIQKADIPIARRSCVSFVIDSLGYVAIGTNASTLNDLWEFHPVQNTWIQKANFPSGGRKYASGFAIDKYGYVGTGESSSSIFSDFWCYNPLLNQWTQKANYPHNVVDIDEAGFSIGCKGYFGTGGTSSGGGGTFYSDFWEYTPDGPCTLGIEELPTSNLDFTISPNPAKEFIVINYPLAGKEKLDITITNVDGKKVYESSIQPLTSDLRLPTSAFSKGIYFIEVTNGKQKAVKKFVKQ